MIPTVSNVEVIQDFATVKYPNYTYKMLIEDEKIVGNVDGLEAIQQAHYKLINTERYLYVIYSWGYGIELADLFGKPIPYVYSELPRRITEASLYDDRVNSVSNFQLSHNKNDVLAKYTVTTIAGTFDAEKGVTISSV